VPLRLSSTCKDAILLQLDAASTTSALSVLLAFLTSASESEAELGRTKTSKLLSAIQQQLQHSGLLECIPELYVSTAEALRSAAALKTCSTMSDSAEAAAADTCTSSSCATAAAQSSSASTEGLSEGSDHVSNDCSRVRDSAADSRSTAGSSRSSSSKRMDSSDSAHPSIRQMEAYSEVLLPLYVQLSTLNPPDVTGTGSSQQLVRDGAGQLAACTITASQLVVAVLLNSPEPSVSKQLPEPYVCLWENLSDKAALALGALSDQLAVMGGEGLQSPPVVSMAMDSAAARQQLLSPNYMLSMSYLTVLTALTAMYEEQRDFSRSERSSIQQQLMCGKGSRHAALLLAASSSSCSGGSSNSTSASSSRRSSASQTEELGDGAATVDVDPSEQRLHEYGWSKLFPGMNRYHLDMLKPFGIHVSSLLWPAMRPGAHALINYAYAAQQLLVADVSMLLAWMHMPASLSELHQHQRQAVQPHMQLMVQCLMLPCVLAQWAPGSRCHSLVANTLSQLVQSTPPPRLRAAGSVSSAGYESSCSATRQHNQGMPSSSAAAASATADGSDTASSQESQPRVVVDAQQITTQMLSDHERFIRSLTRCDLLAKKSHWMNAALCNMAALYQMIQANPFLHWTILSGPNSPEQQQLHSLCCSMLKLSASRMSWRDSTANQLRWAAAIASAAVACAVIPTAHATYVCTTIRQVAGEGPNTSSSHRNHQAAASVGSSCPYSSASECAVAAGMMAAFTTLACENRGAQDSHSKVSSVPGLAIFGRCCLQTSQQLKEQIPVILQQRLGLLRGQPLSRGEPGCPFPGQNCRPFTDAAGACLEPLDLQPVLAGGNSLLHSILRLLGAGLFFDRPARQFEGAEVLQEKLRELDDAAVDAIDTGKATAAPLVALVKQLRVTGLACCSHPVAPMCNNPSCSTTRGDTELELVTGKSCMCGGCRVAHYCCRACQQEHWELHKPACKALMAAKAAAAAAKKVCCDDVYSDEFFECGGNEPCWLEELLNGCSG